MRIVIQGKEVTVTLKSDRDFTTEEIVMAHQLSTGNFEALFVAREDTEDDLSAEEGNEQEKDPVPPSAVNTRKQSSEIPEYVRVEMMCPVCAYKGRPTTRWGNVFTKCPNCQTALHNKFATKDVGVPDKAGNYYRAYERMRPKNGGLLPDEKELLQEMNGGE